jgi:tripartite-type tricarboxylate transporter receptor subunit TctC
MMDRETCSAPRATRGIPRRRAVGYALCIAAGLLVPTAGRAQGPAYPAKPIRIVVGFPAGSTTDMLARAVAEHWRAKLGQPVIVDNRPGANGLLGAAEVARAAPDGYTLLATNSSAITINPQIYRKAGYLPERDFLPLSMVTSAPFIAVVNAGAERTSGVNSIPDLIALARGRPARSPTARADRATWHISPWRCWATAPTCR